MFAVEVIVKKVGFILQQTQPLLFSLFYGLHVPVCGTLCDPAALALASAAASKIDNATTRDRIIVFIVEPQI